jgi:hypothetical protein
VGSTNNNNNGWAVGGGNNNNNNNNGWSTGGGISGGGGLNAVNIVGSSNEGQNVDAQILEQVRQIILRSEASGGTGGLTSSYGVPALKVVGVSLEGIRQAIQVAQYQQTLQGAPIPIAVVPGYNRGPATSYVRPSTTYGAPGWN